MCDYLTTRPDLVLFVNCTIHPDERSSMASHIIIHCFTIQVEVQMYHSMRKHKDRLDINKKTKWSSY